MRHGAGIEKADYTTYGGILSNAIPAIANANSNAGIIYLDGVETSNTLFLPHITNAMNVAGYICWGGHSNWGTNLNDANYMLDGNVVWSGQSGWWIIETIESYNGQRSEAGQGNFIKWFSPNAFGGTNYSNTPVGAVCHVEEPVIDYVNDSSVYFRLWAGGKNFAICAWMSRKTPYFQAVGDPFILR